MLGLILSLWIGSGVLWVRSHQRGDRVAWIGERSGMSIMSGQGLIVLRVYRFEPPWTWWTGRNFGDARELHDIWFAGGGSLSVDVVSDPRTNPLSRANMLGFDLTSMDLSRGNAVMAGTNPLPLAAPPLVIDRLIMPHWVVFVLTTALATLVWWRTVHAWLRA